MSKKMKIPSIFKDKEIRQLWKRPLCNQPQTLSVRACNDDVFTILNSSIESAEYEVSEEEEKQSLEMVISGVRLSERLFFEPEETSSIMRESKTAGKRNFLIFKDSVAISIESDDPYLDFKKSMQEMVESGGLLRDWDCLEELLWWYLRTNEKINHGLIVGAFVDLLLGLFGASSSSSYSEKKKKKRTMMMRRRRRR